MVSIWASRHQAVNACLRYKKCHCFGRRARNLLLQMPYLQMLPPNYPTKTAGQTAAHQTKAMVSVAKLVKILRIAKWMAEKLLISVFVVAMRLLWRMLGAGWRAAMRRSLSGRRRGLSSRRTAAVMRRTRPMVAAGQRINSNSRYLGRGHISSSTINSSLST